jgi:hypothetical protein
MLMVEKRNTLIAFIIAKRDLSEEGGNLFNRKNRDASTSVNRITKRM